MKKKAHFYTNYNNMVVLEGYLNVIKEALVNNGYECDHVTNIAGLDKNDLYIFAMGVDAFKFYWKGYKNYILWQQGATAEESFMRNKNKLRFYILNYIDCFAMKKAKLIFFCSEYMKNHYEKLALKSFDSTSYLMPCFNEKLNKKQIIEKDYTRKNFAYVGSLDLWQCFDRIIDLYKKIETVYTDAHLKVLTFSVDDATQKIIDLGIKNYEVKSVNKEDVQTELEDVVYGFVIRDDSIVNRVATPTKISSYMSVGIIPVFSVVLDDFNTVSQNMEYVIPVQTDIDFEMLKKRIEKSVDKNMLFEEYTHLFDTYYGIQAHVCKISDLIKGIML